MIHLNSQEAAVMLLLKSRSGVTSVVLEQTLALDRPTARALIGRLCAVGKIKKVVGGPGRRLVWVACG